MERLFNAIRDQHPGFEILDVAFTVNSEEMLHNVDDLDAALAESIASAKLIDFEELCAG